MYLMTSKKIVNNVFNILHDNFLKKIIKGDNRKIINSEYNNLTALLSKNAKYIPTIADAIAVNNFL